jgi:hypothetical protein
MWCAVRWLPNCWAKASRCGTRMCRIWSNSYAASTTCQWSNRYLLCTASVMCCVLTLTSAPNQTSLANAARRALLQAGKAAPKHFVSCMGREALNPKNSARARSGALLAIVALVGKYPVSLARVLPSTVQIILRCLDPSDPELRRTLLHSSTAALHVLVQKYPMTSFHQKSQRFAVGTGIAQQSVIIIYDLRTAIKWRILEGHRGNISAISFNAQGNVLVSYSADENPPAFCVWNTVCHLSPFCVPPLSVLVLLRSADVVGVRCALFVCRVRPVC